MSIPSFAVYGVSGTFTTYTWSEQSLGNSNHYAYAHDVHHDGFFHFLDTNPHRLKVVMSVWASVGIPQSVNDVKAYYKLDIHGTLLQRLRTIRVLTITGQILCLVNLFAPIPPEHLEL